MDDNFIQSIAPTYSLYNQKIQNKIDLNNKSNNNYNKIITKKNIKSFRKEILPGNNQIKFKTSKNSPNKNMEELNREYFKENKNIKMDSNNEIIRNTSKLHNEVFNDIFIKKMKNIYSKKSNQNHHLIRPNSNSQLMNQNNIDNYVNNKIGINSNDKRYDLSMNGSELFKNKILNYDNNNNHNHINNSNFYYNHNLINFYNNSFEENEMKNNNNNYLYNNINKNDINDNSKVNSSNSMKMILSNKKDYNLLNRYNHINNYKNNFNLNGNIDNYLDVENDFSNNIIISNKRRYPSNSNLIKNTENKLIKNYLKNNNFKINHNNNHILNQNNSNSNNINRIYAHHRIKSNEEQINKIKKISGIKKINNIKYRKENQKYMIKYENNNNSGINLINKKNNNILDSYEMSRISSELSKINKTSRLNSNNNKLEEDIYHEINNNLNNIDDNIYSNPNRQINNLIKSIEGYINMDQSNKIIRNKDKNNNIQNNHIYKNNYNNSLKIKLKENINNDNSLNNNTERKIKIKKELINSYLNQKPNNQKIKGFSEKANNVVRSSSSNLQKTTQLTSSNNNNMKNIKKVIKNNKNLNDKEICNNIINNISNNISNNNSNINSISVSKSNNFNTINDNKNSTSNNFMIKDYKTKEKFKLSINNSINNNISSNNNSINNIDLGKDIIYQKKLYLKENRTSFNTIQNNNNSIPKIEKFLNNHNHSIKLENIKSKIIKNNLPLTNYQSPTDKKVQKVIKIINKDKNTNENSEILDDINKPKINNIIDNEIIGDNKDKKENNENSIFLIDNNKNNDKNINKNNDKCHNKSESKNDSEINSSLKTNEFENRNISEFPVNDNIIKSKIEKHNNLYMNKNNIMALNEKNKEIENKQDENKNNNINFIKLNEDEKKNEPNKSKPSINTKETKELFKSVHDSDTLIDKENHLPRLNEKILSNIIDKNKFTNNKDSENNNDLKIKGIEFISKNIRDINIDRKNIINKEKDKLNEINDKNEMGNEYERIETENKKEVKDSNNEKENIKLNNSKNDDIINKNIKEKNENEENKEKIENIDLNFIQNKIILEDKNKEIMHDELIQNNINKNVKNEDKNSKDINEDSLGNKNQRAIYKINQKILTKEKKYELIKNMYKQDMLCEPINAKNPKKGNSSITNSKNNIFTTTITKDCEFYQNEQEKLSKYIKDYYQTNKKYPKSNLDFYLYGRQIGHGAFGQVNIALHIASGRLVAIKIFAKKNLKNTRAKQKIKNEIEMLSHFHHPFINQILDNFETDTHIFIVMEYVCGDLLGFIRKRGKLSEAVSKLIFKQLIEGLKYIHKKKVVHRDIKLDNILIDLTNTIKICDFGVSRYYSKDELMFEHCGTPAYISPEIFENNGYKGTGCDIWSAGVTLYYMLGGVQPFKANSIKELEKNIKKGDFKPLEEVSSEANDIIKGMLQVNPKKRFTVDNILNHPWLNKVDLNQRQKLNLFTEAEKILMSKFNVNYLNSDKSELIENFTVKNLEEEENKNSSKNGYTKSIIFAPYNSYIELTNSEDGNENKININFEEDEIYKEIKVMNDICKYGWRAQQANIQYELSNNGDFDNGLIKTQKEEDFKKENEKIEKLYKNKLKKEKKNEFLNKSKDNNSSEDDSDNIKINQEILDKIEKEVGYDKNYVIDCIKKNKVNYATSTYYLMSKEGEYIYESHNNKEFDV